MKKSSEIGSRYKAVREAMRLSQQEIADKIGIEQTAWSYQEREAKRVDPVIVAALVKEGASADYLLKGDGNPISNARGANGGGYHPERGVADVSAPEAGKTPVNAPVGVMERLADTLDRLLPVLEKVEKVLAAPGFAEACEELRLKNESESREQPHSGDANAAPSPKNRQRERGA